MSNAEYAAEIREHVALCDTLGADRIKPLPREVLTAAAAALEDPPAPNLAAHQEIQSAADHMVMLGTEAGALPPYTTARVLAPNAETGEGWRIWIQDHAETPRRSFLDGTEWPQDATGLLAAIRAVTGAFRAVSLGHKRY